MREWWQVTMPQTDRQTGLGIPIGNLTSQILANLYLNEFDRFVRHTIKPLGYLRYGDDFAIFVKGKRDAEYIQACTTYWLGANLGLKISVKNDVIFPAKNGLKFLGHAIYHNSPVSIDQAMIRKINLEISPCNAASYRAMHLTKKQSKLLPWQLFENLERGVYDDMPDDEDQA